LQEWFGKTAPKKRKRPWGAGVFLVSTWGCRLGVVGVFYILT